MLPDVWNDLAAGNVSLGDVISSAARGFVERMFGSSPILQDLNEAAQQAARAAQANQQAARQAHPGQRPHAGSPPGSASRSGSRAGSPPPRSPRGPDPKILTACTTLGFDSRSMSSLTEAMISDRRKQLARIYHPDRPGGSTSQMQKINAAADLLIAQLGKPT